MTQASGIRAAVVTVSDRSFRKERPDLSGPAVVNRILSAGHAVPVTAIVPDEREEIAVELRRIADGKLADVIFTTGGTGVAPRDVTPEATRDAVDREIPGIPELMRHSGLKSTPFSSLSRAVAGNRGPVLIINLPGSPAGAVDSLDAILGLVPHVLRQLNGLMDHETQNHANQSETKA